MKNGFTSRLLSVALSATLAMSSFVPAYAAAEDEIGTLSAEESAGEAGDTNLPSGEDDRDASGSVIESVSESEEDKSGAESDETGAFEGGGTTDNSDAAEGSADTGELADDSAENKTLDNDEAGKEEGAADEAASEEVLPGGEASEDIQMSEEIEDADVLNEDAEEITLTSIWDTTYTVRYHLNNSAKDVYTTKKYTYAKNGYLSLDPEKGDLSNNSSFAYKGHTFECWKCGSDTFTVEQTIGDVIAYADENDLTSVDLYAVWGGENTYKIRFLLNAPAGADAELYYGKYHDGSEEPMNYEEPLYLTCTEFTLAGYTLTGWKYTDDSGKEISVKPTDTISKLTETNDNVVELKAQWQPRTYKITYDLNGGTAKSGVKTTVTYGYDATTKNGVALLNYKENNESPMGYSIKAESEQDVTREGYRFLGWNGRDYYSHYGKETPLFTDMSLKAVWEQKSYAFLLDFDGGIVYRSSGNVSNMWYTDAHYDESYTLKNIIPVKVGYTFKGWSATAANGSSTTIPANTSLKLNGLKTDEDVVIADGEGNVTTYKGSNIKAVWAASSNKITYNLSGGKISGQPKTYTTGLSGNSAVTIPVPTKDGMKFDGWDVTLDGEWIEESQIFDSELLEEGKYVIRSWVGGDLVLTANWEFVTYNITFYDENGVEYETQPYDYAANELNQYLNCTYSDRVNFSDAIAVYEKIKISGGDTDAPVYRYDNKSIKGFALEKGGEAKYIYGKYYTKLAGKNAQDTELKLYAVTEAKVNRIIYDTDGGALKSAVYNYKKSDKATAIKATAVKKGYTFLGWKPDGGYDSQRYVNYDENEDYVVSIKENTAVNIKLNAVYEVANEYSITLMPNAKDVYEGETKIDASKGKAYMDGLTFLYDTESKLKNPSWTREGYSLLGFSTNPRDKVGEEEMSLGGLGGGTAKNVKLYAIWQADSNLITFSDEAKVYRGTSYENDMTVGSLGTFEQNYGEKVVKTNKISKAGYTFKGWTIESGDSSNPSGVDVALDKNGYVTSIKKTNRSDLTLTPVFEENKYKVYIDPKGGSIDGNTKKYLTGEYYYTDYLEDSFNDEDGTTIYEGLYSDIAELAKRSGYVLSYISTTSNSKGQVATINNGEVSYSYSGRQRRLSSKNNGSVTLSLIWTKVTANTPDVYGAFVRNGGIEVYINNASSSLNYNYEVEYSTNPLFIFSDGSYRSSAVNGVVTIPNIDTSRHYYVRVMELKKDSTGEFGAKSKWSSVVRVSSATN
ncbi:MAG: InlB B-repeat-containing protein [Butyrivibrio sp.]|nr:InlB B-repeat-containing protein [Butyrivibrio sp.]